MNRILAFQVSNSLELKRILDEWGTHAPERLERRGKQKELERWVIARWLDIMNRAAELSYPFEIYEGEAPDFILRSPDGVVGVEVTEAVDPAEQKRWTQEAKDDLKQSELVVRHIEDKRPVDAEKLRKLIECATDKKSQTSTDPSGKLLIYLNTEATIFFSTQELMSVLMGARTVIGSFSEIYVYGKSELFELIGGKHLA